jgi:hypothetical protein
MNLGEGIIGAVISAVVGWLASSLTKVSKADHKDVVRRLEALERDLTTRMTRAEVEQRFDKIEKLVTDFRSEARYDLKELKSELKSKT